MRFAGPHVAAWWAETGTAGRSEGCNKPFWQEEDAKAYVREHGGYIKPLFETPVLVGSEVERTRIVAAIRELRFKLHDQNVITDISREDAVYESCLLACDVAQS